MATHDFSYEWTEEDSKRANQVALKIIYGKWAFLFN